MKNLLTKPRSIAGATLWGVIVAFIIFFGLIALDFMLSIYQTNFGPARQVESIAVGGGYSVSLEATPAHPMLAEYKQSIAIYGGKPRGGSMLGRVEIPMNTGGRVRIGVLVPKQAGKLDVVFADRYSITQLDLVTKQTKQLKSWKLEHLKPIGIISGASYPIKFIPCSIWGRLSDEEQTTIMRLGNELEGFCEMH